MCGAARGTLRAAGGQAKASPPLAITFRVVVNAFGTSRLVSPELAGASRFHFMGIPGTINASAKSATAIHNGAFPVVPDTIASIRAITANTKLIDM
jgi:hypothetical protein